MIFKKKFSEPTAGSAFSLVLRQASLIVVLAIVLTGCSSDEIKCWPFCGKSSSGVTDTTTTDTTTTDTTTTDTTTTDTTTTVVASITVTYPSGGEAFAGGTYLVTWTKSSSVGTVRIELYNNASTLERWLGERVIENSINWEVQEKSGLYKIKVSSISDPTVYDYSDYFLVETRPQDDQY